MSGVHKIQVRFIARELFPGMENGEYEIADGSSVRDLLFLLEGKFDTKLQPEKLEFVLPLLNGKRFSLDDQIHDSGKLHLCRTIVGG